MVASSPPSKPKKPKKPQASEIVATPVPGQDDKPQQTKNKKKRGPPKRAAPKPAALPPSQVLDLDDPGDATQRNFRYQHAYGVVLLASAATSQHPYVALWCEHHEDLLAERKDQLWDGYQVKTRKREEGEWDLGDDEVWSAIKHLTFLDMRFPARIAGLYLVSNARFHDPEGDTKAGRSLPRLLAAVRGVGGADALTTPFDTSFQKLCTDTTCEVGPLFAALQKLRLLIGPERESFDAEISHNHISSLPGCASLDRKQLNSLRDELVARVYRASSLSSDDASRHWCCVSGDDSNHPELAAKRISVSDVLEIVSMRQAPPFRYLPSSTPLVPGSSVAKLPRLDAKLLAAGLQSQTEVFRARMFATERQLLQATATAPEDMSLLLDQLEGVVRAEYSEALLQFEGGAAPYGRSVLSDVYARLKAVVQSRPAMVRHQPYELLAGIAAMLTAECHFWWGPTFDLEDQS